MLILVKKSKSAKKRGRTGISKTAPENEGQANLSDIPPAETIGRIL